MASTSPPTLPLGNRTTVGPSDTSTASLSSSAIRLASRSGDGVCWIDLNRGEIGRYGGSGLGKAVVRGHETAMLDTGNLQRRPLDGSGMERATLDKSGIETRDRRK